jgi:phage baseplate assembly protein W
MSRFRSLDRPHLGVGVPFPLRPTGGRLAWAYYEDAVERSIAQILLTGPGERVMLPAFGAGLPSVVFAPNTPATRARVADAVRQALRASEPRIRVEDVVVSTSDEEPNLLLVDLDYVVLATNSAFNRVFPFYLTEGI